MTETVKSAAKAKVAVKTEPKRVVIKATVPEDIAPDKIVKTEKPKKLKLVRDSFSMPQHDYANIAAIKARCLKAGVSAKKSEVLRAALVCISKLSDKDLFKLIGELEGIKTGRPAKA
jgi:hypothetical protein